MSLRAQKTQSASVHYFLTAFGQLFANLLLYIIFILRCLQYISMQSSPTQYTLTGFGLLDEISTTPSQTPR